MDPQKITWQSGGGGTYADGQVTRCVGMGLVRGWESCRRTRLEAPSKQTTYCTRSCMVMLKTTASDGDWTAQEI